MMHIETFKEGRKTYIKLPEIEFNNLLEELEELRDIHTVRSAKKNIAAGIEETLPFELVKALVDAEHSGQRIAIWRKYRAIKRDQLAEKVGVTGSYISMIESGKRKGDIMLFKMIAQALRCDVDVLL
ncbi:MAG: helix-turn-helix transcriptional regulator [Rickettsiales bacterium]